jgi:hypothetical protein
LYRHLPSIAAAQGRRADRVIASSGQAKATKKKQRRDEEIEKPRRLLLSGAVL